MATVAKLRCSTFYPTNRTRCVICIDYCGPPYQSGCPQKTGEYGDEKQERFYVKLSPLPGPDDWSSERQPAWVIDAVRSLELGSTVHLDWDHNYVETRWADGTSAKSPERPVTHIELIAAEGAR